jgi:hypothetical protein
MPPVLVRDDAEHELGVVPLTASNQLLDSFSANSSAAFLINQPTERSCFFAICLSFTSVDCSIQTVNRFSTTRAYFVLHYLVKSYLSGGSGSDTALIRILQAKTVGLETRFRFSPVCSGVKLRASKREAHVGKAITL